MTEISTPNPKPQVHNPVDVNIEAQEAMGIMILSVLFFLVLMALLRSQKRERKLLREIANLNAKLNHAK
jgi:hypothetical protein